MLQDEKMEHVKSNVKQLNIDILSWGAATDPGHPGGLLVSVITVILKCIHPVWNTTGWENCKYVSNHTQRARFPTTLCVDRRWTRSPPALLGLRWGLVADELLTYWRSDNVPSVWAIQPQSCPSASGSSARTVAVASSFVSFLKPFMSPLVLSHSAISTAPRCVNVWWPAEACCLPRFQLPLKAHWRSLRGG